MIMVQIERLLRAKMTCMYLESPLVIQGLNNTVIAYYMYAPSSPHDICRAPAEGCVFKSRRSHFFFKLNTAHNNLI